VAKSKYEDTGKEKGIYFYGCGEDQLHSLSHKMFPPMGRRTEENDESFGRGCALGANGRFALVSMATAYLFT
jgi:hypothetical protein